MRSPIMDSVINDIHNTTFFGNHGKLPDNCIVYDTRSEMRHETWDEWASEVVDDTSLAVAYEHIPTPLLNMIQQDITDAVNQVVADTPFADNAKGIFGTMPCSDIEDAAILLVALQLLDDTRHIDQARTLWGICMAGYACGLEYYLGGKWRVYKQPH